MPKKIDRRLDVTVEGVEHGGKTTLVWLLLQSLETMGATVKLHGEDGDAKHANFLSSVPHSLRPGMLRDMVVNITTKTVERDGDDQI